MFLCCQSNDAVVADSFRPVHVAIESVPVFESESVPVFESESVPESISVVPESVPEPSEQQQTWTVSESAPLSLKLPEPESEEHQQKPNRGWFW